MTEQASSGSVVPPPGDPVAGVVQVVELEAAAHAWEISPGVVVHGHAFNGQVPGPALEATVGDTLAVRFINRLPGPARIHWQQRPGHLSTAEGAPPDGPAQPGASLEYLIALSESGTFCYHIPATTTIGQGLHGLLIVAPSGEPCRDRDRCLVITAVRTGLSDAGRPADRCGPAEQEILLVDGVLQPRMGVAPGRRERWQLINLTGHKLRLSLNRGGSAAASSESRGPRGSEVRPVLAPWGQLRVALGPFVAGEVTRLTATAERSGGGDQNGGWRLAVIHAAC